MLMIIEYPTDALLFLISFGALMVMFLSTIALLIWGPRAALQALLARLHYAQLRHHDDDHASQ